MSSQRADSAEGELLPARSLPDAVARVDSDGLLIACNAPMGDLMSELGVDRLDDLPLAPRSFDCLLSGEPVGLGVGDRRFDLRLTVDGERRWLLARPDPGIGRVEALELARRRSRVLGEIASSVAHDLANLLLSGIAMAETLQPYVTDPADSEELAGFVKGVRQGNQLCRAIVCQLGSDARSWTPLPLHAIVDDVVALVSKNAVRRGVDLEVRVPDEAIVRVDAAEAVQGVVLAVLCGTRLGAERVDLVAEEVVARAVAGRTIRSVILRVRVRPIEAEAARRVADALRRDPKGLRALQADAENLFGLFAAGIAMARAGGELRANAEGDTLGFEFVWPAAD